ncbi:CGNR zinc finger domain-containing protein [Actinopolymorpha sp. NPDC004070]|uniref:CGNR zinc finger domain-containing protein n=1 Tax=Actinopolymorpha sp. NPDC004070 TaxID=3154548 RepID=UPI0033AFF053
MTESPADRVPPPAELLTAFVNTYDVDLAEPERLPDPAALTAWLRSQALLAAEGAPPPASPAATASTAATASPVAATDDDLALARVLRAGLRQAMRQHHDGDLTAVVPELDRAAARLPLRVTFTGTAPALVPAGRGVPAALAALVAAVATAQAEGSWQRLKLCAAPDCEWAFLDSSKNRSRHWCSMGSCGNRQKTRAYRARQKAADRMDG